MTKTLIARVGKAVALLILALTGNGMCMGQTIEEAKTVLANAVKSDATDLEKQRQAKEARAQLGGPLQGCQLAYYINPLTEEADQNKFTVIFMKTSLTDAELLSLIAPLQQENNLSKLDLRFTKVTGRGFKELNTITNLTELDLSSTPLCYEGLCELRCLEQLEKVTLKNTYLRLNGLNFFLGANSKLRSLDLAGVTVSDDQLKKTSATSLFQTIGELKELRELDLSGMELNASDLAALQQLGKLKKLYLANTKLTDPLLEKFDFARFANLTQLSLAGNDLTDKKLAQLAKPAKLTTLNLSGTKLTDVILLDIVKTNNQLKDLDVSKTTTMVNLEVLNSFGGLTKLKTLNLSGTGVNDNGLKTIWRSFYPPANFNRQSIDSYLKFIIYYGALESLDISSTRVSDKGLMDDDQQEMGFPMLKFINYGDTKVTSGGINRHIAFFGGIQISSKTGISSAPKVMSTKP